MQIYPLNDNLYAVLSGMGEKSVRQASALLLENRIEALVCFGTCAALAGDLRAGDLILAKSVVTEDGERLFSPEIFCESIRKYLNAGAVSVHLEDNYTSTKVIRTVSEKIALAQRTGATTVDMESAIVFRIAQENNLAALSLKVVVDESHVSIPPAILDNTDDYGQANIVSLLLCVIQQPTLALDLFRLGRAFSRAKAKMHWVGKHAGPMFSSL